MKEIHIKDIDILNEVIKVFTGKNPVAVLEFPRVYGLMAPHSLLGAQAMSQVKNRLPQKYYGSFMGNDGAFRKMVPKALHFFLELLTPELGGASFRFPIQSSIHYHDVTTYKGTHQVLIVPNEEIKNKLYNLDNELEKIFPQSDFYDVNYQSPLVTSLNVSGANEGAIVKKKEALDFAFKMNIPLFIHTDYLDDHVGSYPIFSIDHKGVVTCERFGLGYQDIERALLRHVNYIS
jgi:hypothetical protein